ncbi:hypothetical protein QMG90_01980 [Trabulsiella odontotermitis]|uniref:hypothetical protein n=1 Tax=Trabulsiella odontotermitis TaxID=379893 RepID=UPI0024B72CAB|nr:hypothetical protein [Trabulsiella odontotermitis]WHP31742.1 hypothetical protein QMG90_01980 [Trabulsiella odontotermitis]
MNKKSQQLDYINQAELADALGVDRTTIGTWTKKGLPFIRGDQGKPHSFHFGCSMWWMLGKEFAERRCIPGLNAVQQIILARIISEGLSPDECMADEECVISLLAKIGIPESTVIIESAYVRGLLAGDRIAVERRNKKKSTLSN